MTGRPPTRRTVTAGLLAAGLALAGPPPVPAAPVPAGAGAAEMEALWADLAKDDLTASRALLKLSVKPKEAVVFLREKLKPLRIDEKQVRALLVDLGSEKEETWKAAYEEVSYYDPRLAINLATLMDEVTDRLPRARMVAVLSGDRTPESLLEQNTPISLGTHGNPQEGVFYNFRCKGSWWAEHKVERLNEGDRGNRRKYWTRAARAIVLLEHIGTPAAVAILTEMTTGHPDAQPTRAAKASVKRLAAK